jgi:ubiquinone/menaquinone biosynthesis C-methylase UbiE
MTENLDFFKNNIKFYSEGYKDFCLKPWEEKLIKLVKGQVLDVACGGGRIAVPMLRNGCDVTATDFVIEFEERIRIHEREFLGKFNFVPSPMDNLPFPDNSFDCVTCINSIIYMKNVEGVRKAISEMARVLKYDGNLFFTSWNMLHPLWGTSIIINYLTRRSKRFGETSPFFKIDNKSRQGKVHMFVPTRRELEYMCKDSGISAKVYTSNEFMGNHNLKTPFYPTLVIVGKKK